MTHHYYYLPTSCYPTVNIYNDARQAGTPYPAGTLVAVPAGTVPTTRKTDGGNPIHPQRVSRDAARSAFGTHALQLAREEALYADC